MRIWMHSQAADFEKFFFEEKNFIFVCHSGILLSCPLVIYLSSQMLKKKIQGGRFATDQNMDNRYYQDAEEPLRTGSFRCFRA